MSSECEHILPMRTGTCLHTAAIKGNVKIFKMLLENGADVNAKDKDVCKKMTDGDEVSVRLWVLRKKINQVVAPNIRSTQ